MKITHNSVLHSSRQYFKSKIFKRMFFSYILIIGSFFLIYSFAIVAETSRMNKERQSQFYRMKTEELANILDLQFTQADIIVSNINSSDYIRQFSRTTDMRENANTYQVLSEIKNYMIASYNINIYDTVLFLNGWDKAYSSIQGYSLNHLKNNYDQSDAPKINTTSLNHLFSFSNDSTVFSKEWMIYNGYYNSVTAKGRICILFDKDAVVNNLWQAMGEESNLSFYFNDELLFAKGKIVRPLNFEKKSYVNRGITYRIEVDESNFSVNEEPYMVAAVGIAGIISAGFVILSLFLSKKYYQPINSIENMVDYHLNSEKIRPDSKNELDNIISGIKNLIGERNGYREKIISIKPFAQQGMIHGMLNGNLEPEKLEVLLEDEYMVLQKPYYLLSIINIAYVGNDVSGKEEYRRIKGIIYDIAKEYMTEDQNIALYDKDIYNTFAIINSNVNNGLDEIYDHIYEKMVKRMDNRSYAVTIGVDQIREDISELSEACNNAIKTLGSMVIGGRGTVYFHENEIRTDKQRYYFPKDSLNRLTKDLKDRNLQNIRLYLDSIMEINTKKYDLSLVATQLLIDEVHITIVKALKNVDAFQTIDFEIEKVKTVATLEEVFQYYYAILETICKRLDDIKITNRGIGVLEKSLLQCIQEEYRNSNMSLQYLTEKFGVSNKYISIVCRKHLGMTYLQYLQEKRIEYAVIQMETTAESLEFIARNCGYTNLLTFRRNFKAVKGINPSEYLRNQMV